MQNSQETLNEILKNILAKQFLFEINVSYRLTIDIINISNNYVLSKPLDIIEFKSFIFDEFSKIYTILNTSEIADKVQEFYDYIYFYKIIKLSENNINEIVFNFAFNPLNPLYIINYHPLFNINNICLN